MKDDTYNYTSELIQGFLDDVDAGKVPQFYRSEPVPEVDYVNGTTTLVGKTFHDHIHKNGTDACVLIYDTRAEINIEYLLKMFQHLAAHFEEVENFTMALMDNALNQCEETEDWEGPFQLRLYLKDDKEHPLMFDHKNIVMEGPNVA